MKCSAQLAGFAVLMALGTCPSWGAVSGSVTGVVRDSAGVPQIGAEVELLRPDLSVVTSVYTNSLGRFTIASILPGHYALKAMDTSFLPSLRENVRVRGSRTVVNLTLNTLYEVIQWLPSEPRSGNAGRDDWAWTLRSAADRPLLRWLEDGPLVVVSDGSGTRPKLKARLMATGQAGTFGESGQRFSTTVEDTPSNSRELLARVDFAPDSDAAMESMLGFRQDLGYAGSVQSVAAITLHPDVESAGNAGMDEAALHSWETMRLGDTLEVEAGSNAVIARMGGRSPSTAAAALPFASAEWRKGASTVGYRMVTMTASVASDPAAMSETETAAALPQFSARGDRLALEHGLHQEIGWERRTDSSGMALLVYTDEVDNPVLEAKRRFAGNDSGAAAIPSGVLFDAASGLMRAAGPNFSSTGVRASFERRLPGGEELRATYASGSAVVMPALPPAKPLSQLLTGAYARHVQSYAISLSGTLEGTKTHWRASYRWQPEDTVTPVDPFALDALAPYLNLRLRQCIHHCGEGSTGVEALIEVRNLLAEGYHPYLAGDGSVLIFAQDQRSLRGGLAFTF